MHGSPSVTMDDWAALDEDDSRELVDGVLEEAEVPSALHEIIVTRPQLQLGPYFRDRGGVTLGAVKLAIAARRGRIPDLTCYLTTRGLPLDGVLRTPPDLLIEVVSSRPEDQRRDRIAKPQDYAELGARAYWIIDPWLRSIEMLSLDEQGRYVRMFAATEGRIDPVPGLPGLALELDAMWAEIDRLG
jgi:Uma2 family endonuclease